MAGVHEVGIDLVRLPECGLRILTVVGVEPRALIWITAILAVLLSHISVVDR
jgi:hypothetical protein